MVNVTFTIIPIPLFLSSIMPRGEVYDINLGMMPAALQVPESLLVPGLNPSHNFLHALDQALLDMVKDIRRSPGPLPKSIIEIPENDETPPFPTAELDVSPLFLESVTDFLSYLVSTKFYNSQPPVGMVLPQGVKILPPESIEEAALAAFIGPPPAIDSVLGAPASLHRKIEHPYYEDRYEKAAENLEPASVRSDEVSAWEDYYGKLRDYTDYYNRAASAPDNGWTRN